MTSKRISPALFEFLSDLKANNDRTWFAENKQRYLESVRDPMLEFISEFAIPLAKISPHFRADSRPNGGSLFRIHRDTRFSKDKSPYKTNVGAHFRHESFKDAYAPGFYLHLEPGACFAGLGIWRPDSKSLGGIRRLIAESPQEWTDIPPADRGHQAQGFHRLGSISGRNRRPRRFRRLVRGSRPQGQFLRRISVSRDRRGVLNRPFDGGCSFAETISVFPWLRTLSLNRQKQGSAHGVAGSPTAMIGNREYPVGGLD